MKKNFAYLVITVWFGCTHSPVTVIELHADKDLIPEGITILDKKAFISSIHKNKIIEYDLVDETVSDFIQSDQFNFRSGVGMVAKGNRLFALANDMTGEQRTSALFVFDIPTSRLIKTYTATDGGRHFFNDLVVTSADIIFITDSEGHSVYTVNFSSDSSYLEKYLTDTAISYPNGITISGDENKLFVASGIHGIRVIDLASRRISNKPSPATRGIDGMKFHKGSIYAIKNTEKDRQQQGLIAVTLNADQSDISEVKPLVMGHPRMNIPTTLAIHRDHIYIIGNSQLENLDQTNNQIIDPEELTNTFLLKIKI